MNGCVLYVYALWIRSQVERFLFANTYIDLQVSIHSIQLFLYRHPTHVFTAEDFEKKVLKTNKPELWARMRICDVAKGTALIVVIRNSKCVVRQRSNLYLDDKDLSLTLPLSLSLRRFPLVKWLDSHIIEKFSPFFVFHWCASKFVDACRR